MINKTLNYTNSIRVDKAYIITLKDNKISEEMADRCAKSCEKVGMEYEIWEAFDGTGDKIKTPKILKNESWLSWLKWTDAELSLSEVACALSHISLWAKCVEQDKPLVILEHDAVMLKPYKIHTAYNAIVYLGGVEQVKGWKINPVPPHGTKGPNYHFICRAHAYAIDPIVAKNLLAHIIKYGIHESLDIMIRADIFTIIQNDLYAYNESGETIITNRKKTQGGGER